jgi:AIPR protein
MAITKQDKHDLDQVHSDWFEKYGGCKEDYFACMYLTTKFHCTVPSVGARIAFGGNDYGLDAYYIDPDTKNLYLYQFKWSENHNLFKDSLDRLAKDGMNRIFGNPMADPTANELLNMLRAELHEYRSAIKHVLVHFVFKGDVDAAEESEGLRSRQETLENKAHLVHSYFGDGDIDLSVEFIAERRRPPMPKPVESFKISYSQHVSVETQDDKKLMYVGFLPLMDLHRIYKSLGLRFLDRNIRFGLSFDNAPNIKIREALSDMVLKQKTKPDVFAFNHNGVTLAAEQMTFEDGHAIIKVPRLLNGAQTVTSVDKFLTDNDGNPAIEGNAAILESIKVLAKIVVDDPSSVFVTNVTICNNRQNPVEPWNLRANDRIQCDLHDKLREEAGVFYSRQENAFRHYSFEDLEEMGVDTAKDVRIRPLAQTFLAVQGEITRMSKLPDVFENQKWYEETFRESYVHSDSRKIVIAYKVHLVLKDPVQRLVERSNQKLATAIGRARNLVWALLIQAILNDTKLPQVLEDYGSNLRKEAAFREYLRTLASSKLFPILKDVLSRDEYKDRMEKERYDFLRSKEVFNQCKEVAAERFGWLKKTF